MSDPQADLWTAVRLMAEGSDWRRDQGETLTAWAQRKLRASQPEGGDITPKVQDLIFAARRVWKKYGHDEAGIESDWTEWVDLRDALEALSTPQRQPEQCTYPKCGCVGSCQYQRTAAGERE